MGSFYTNITLRGPNQDQVAAYLKQKGRWAFVSPTLNGNTLVYDAATEDQTDEIERLGTELSKQFECVALSALNHDDDVLLCGLYDKGVLLDTYNSAPSFFDDDAGLEPQGGNAKLFCHAFNVDSIERVNAVLHAPFEEHKYVFAVERHAELARALGIESAFVTFGYNYLPDITLPQEFDNLAFVRTGGSDDYSETDPIEWPEG